MCFRANIQTPKVKQRRQQGGFGANQGKRTSNRMIFVSLFSDAKQGFPAFQIRWI